MGGGLMQLVAYGAQDIYLTGNPQITFFKVVYRRHTNFSMESIQQTFNGEANFGRRVTTTISRNGDLIHRMYLQVSLPEWETNIDGNGWCDYFGLNLIKNVEVEIGGQRIDKHYSEWLYVWNELTQCHGKKLGYDEMVGASVISIDNTVPATTLYIPLEFWFCRNPGLALPLIALQYHEVKLNIELNDKSKCVDIGEVANANVPNLTSAILYVDYIYLDTDERRRFAQVSHEYLIEQLQFTGDEIVTAGQNKIKLNLNHPVKELVWVTRSSEAETNNRYFDFTQLNGNPNPTLKALLQLNGHDRFSERNGSYFDLVQPYQHHTNVPEYRGINVYSFALKPEEHQPSGTCNFSRIDNATLSLNINDATNTTLGGTTGATLITKVFAVNYNVLRIMSGMGGLAYSN